MSLPLREAQWIVKDDPPHLDSVPRRATLRERRPEIILGVGSVALILACCRSTDGFISFCGFFFGLGGLLLALAFCLARVEDQRVRSYDDARSQFEGGHGLLVSILIRQGDAPTGADTGILWFEDAYLYFLGRRTSFGLVPSQSRGSGRIRDRVAGIRNSIELPLRRDTALGSMTLSLDPLHAQKGDDVVARDALMAGLDRWSRLTSDESGQFPPAAPGPGVASDARLLRHALGQTLVGSALFGIIGHFLVPRFEAVLVLAGAWTFVGIVPSSNLRWRALRDRYRLRSLR